MSAYSSPEPPLVVQGAITPRLQTVRNLLMWASWFAVIVFGVICYPWYAGVLAFLGCQVLSAFVKVLFIPKADSNYFHSLLVDDLKERIKGYQMQNDLLRIEAAETTLEQLQGLRR